MSIAVFAAFDVSGCRRPSTTVVPASDSVRGGLSLVGTAPNRIPLIGAPLGGGEPVALSGDQSFSVESVVGLEIVAHGRFTGARELRAGPRGARLFDVASFTVRSADGVVATDGIVVARGDAFLLRLADGREVRVSEMPPALRTKVGARVWLAGALTAAPSAYGVIAERP